MTYGASHSLTPGSAEAAGASPAGVAWVDGEYIAAGEARISVFDYGFSLSNCTLEVAAVWDGAFFRLDDHLDRLLEGCERLQFESPPTRQQVRDVMFEMVRRSGLREAYVMAIVTRGVARLDGPRDLRGYTSALYGYAVPYRWILPREKHEHGLELVIARSVTRIPPSAVDPTVKNFQRGDFVRGQLEAYERGGTHCLLTDGNGLLTEGEGFNVVALVDGTLYTPADGVLRGITRRVAFEIAEDLGIATQVGPLPVELAKEAEEMFVTSTAGGIMAVATVDGEPVGAGKEGPITRQIRDRYWELHYDPRHTDPVDYDASGTLATEGVR